MIGDLWRLNVINVNNHLYLLPGTWEGFRQEYLTVDPSYYAPYVYRKFAQYDAASRKMVRNRGIAQSGSASALGAECREFESLYPDHFPPTLLLHRCLQHVSV